MDETAINAHTGAIEKTDRREVGAGQRRPGRAPGLPKAPGSGRKRGSGNHVTKDAKEGVSTVLDKNAGPVFTRLCQIALGRKIRLGAGPNATTVYPSETSQMKAIEILARKLRPDLSAVEQTVDQTVREEGPTNPRDLARSVLDVLRMAELEDAPKPDQCAQLRNDAQLTQQPENAPGKVEGHPSTAEPENPSGVYTISETAFETCLSNGARVVGIPDAHGDLTRWRPIDLRGMEHRTFTDRSEATEFAKGLPAIIEPNHSEGPHVTIDGVKVDPHDMGIPRECRESFFDRKRPRVIRSRRQLRT